ncbi:MAG: AAA family ATPase [Rickettsiales endosymbiont of Dermacentor nuttalli]
MLSKNLELSLHRALNIALEYKHEYATLEHLLLALSDDPDAKNALRVCNANIALLCNRLKEFLNRELSTLACENLIEAKPTAGFQRVVHRAALHMSNDGQKEITGVNVLAEILGEHESFAVFFLHEQSVTKNDIINYIIYNANKTENVVQSNSNVQLQKSRVNNREETDNISSILKESKDLPNVLVNCCVNLNKMAEEGQLDILVGRDNEIERTIEVLCRRTKNNPLYVGEPGVGKTAIVEGLALRIVKGMVPISLKNAVIFSLDMGSLVAGTRYRGDFEERIKAIVREIQKLDSAILFIDEIHTIIGAGATSGGSLDAGNLLKPVLSRGKLRCIGATTFKEYKDHFEKDNALTRRFQKIVVEEPSVANTIKILKGLKSYYEEHHGIRYTKGALEAAAILSERYITERHLPDKAIDVLDEAGSHHKIMNKNKIITVRDIENIIARIAHIPSRALSINDSHKLMKLQDELKKVMFGQDKAIEELVLAIKLSKAGLRDSKRPIGCYLFSGPTGVGKTELAKQLALLIDMELLRFDMSEYMEQHSVSRLIGTPPGYVGFDQGGLLSDAVSKNPYSVILLDEIEKAHRDIYNILLQVMDYGHLTDNTGKTINFTHSIIIMTTNAGAFEMSKPVLGFGKTRREYEDTEQINLLFTPEFIGRLDAIIPFSPLSLETIAYVVDKFLKHLSAQLSERSVIMSITNHAKNYLCQLGQENQTKGARIIEKTIDEKIRKKLADEILFGKLAKGGKIEIDLLDDQLLFNYH